MPKGIYRLFRTRQEFESFWHACRVVTQQQTLDILSIALYDRFQFTPADFKALQEEFAADWQEMSDMGIEDAKDDRECVYTKEKIDRKLKIAFGEEGFKPWDERYTI